MKKHSFFISLFLFSILVNCQNPDIETLYQESMEAYDLGKFDMSAEKFQEIIDNYPLEDISSNRLYNGACSFALAKQNNTAIDILEHLAQKRYYDYYDHIIADKDLVNLHSNSKWQGIINRVAENKKTKPIRFRETIKSELFKAKEILSKDKAKLWGESIWDENILILGFDNTIYSLKELPESETTDGIIYFKKIPENTLGFSNSAQKFNGEEYAVVMENYLNDNSATIIHELFHILQNKHISLNGDPIKYLENFDAREWLRLEYQALRNALNSIIENMDTAKVQTYLNDAVLFRKIRQTKYDSYLQKEIEIETCEGLANYTGHLLSTYPNKYEKAIAELNEREQAKTYTRPFPYATGPAYGFLFDYLDIDWKDGLNKTYNFLKIYEEKVLKKAVITNNKNIELAKKRNNYQQIHKEEVERKKEIERIEKYYTEMFINKPTLSVEFVGQAYGLTYNMYGTLFFKDKGMVYSMMKGIDGSGKNFGNFSTISGKELLGSSGILLSTDGNTLTFPYPLEINGNKIIGEHYTIELNEGWEVAKDNKTGNMTIVKSM